MADEEFVEAVLAVVERIPPGRVMTYGAIAEYLGRGGPRMVGSVMARYGDAVAWHRVVSAAGVTTTVEAKGRARLVAEGTPMRGDRVDLRLASWYPPD